jgi:hypothetical protein
MIIGLRDVEEFEAQNMMDQPHGEHNAGPYHSYVPRSLAGSLD